MILNCVLGSISRAAVDKSISAVSTFGLDLKSVFRVTIQYKFLFPLVSQVRNMVRGYQIF
jgi:hypothetical protein